jgi:hypothetical protein
MIESKPSAMRSLFMPLILLACLSCAALQAEGLDESRFREIQAELAPSADEPWRTIPWKIGLLDAQREAARERKPMFIWAMDGHPLGCT